MTHGGSDFETREVELGPSNDKFIVVEKGVEPDEMLVLNPRQYRDRMTIPDLPDPPKTAPGPGKKKGKGKGGGGGAKAGPPSIADIVERIIGANDSDEDGKLSAEEIASMEGPQDMVKAADTNGDGSVDKTELTISMAKRRAQREAEGGGGPPGAGGGRPGGPPRGGE